MDWAKDLTNIAVLFIGVAALALLVSHAQGTTSIIGATTGGFGSLLSTVENPQGGNGSMGNSGNAMSGSGLLSPSSFAAFNAGGA
jgi:hypothetical protein